MKKKNHLKKNKTKNRDKNLLLSDFLVSKTVIYVSLGVFGVIAFISLTWTVSQGDLLQYDSPLQTRRYSNVLGENQNEEEKKLEEQKKEDEKKSETFKTSTAVTNGLKIKTEQEGNKNETEIETAAGQKIKTKIEDNGTTEIEMEHGELKIKYKLVSGEVVKNVENEQGEKVELKNDELHELENEVEQELEDDGIKISTESGRPAFFKNGITATTEFPLSVDVGTNQLIITTPAGQKIVAILPDQAVQNMIATGIINQINSPQPESTGSGQLAAGTNLVELKVRNSEPVYEVNGTKIYRLFGLFAVSQPVKAVVSAETGDLVTTQKSFLTNVVDLLSP